MGYFFVTYGFASTLTSPPFVYFLVSLCTEVRFMLLDLPNVFLGSFGLTLEGFLNASL